MTAPQNPKRVEENIVSMETYARMAQTLDKLETQFSLFASSQLEEHRKKNILMDNLKKYWKLIIIILSILTYSIPKSIQIAMSIESSYESLIGDLRKFDDKVDLLLINEQIKIEKEQIKIEKSEENNKILLEIRDALRNENKKSTNKQ